MLLNGNKSDAVVLSTRQQSRKLPNDPVIRIAGCDIKVSNSVRSLGVVLDDKLTFDKHVAEICRNCYYHIKAFREIRRFLTKDIACSVARSIVLSRLDYCNSLLYKSSEKNIAKLQRIQNSLVKIIYELPWKTSTKTYMEELHWLPVRERITYKIGVMTYKCKYNLAPSYLSVSIKNYAPTRQLRSTSANLLVEPVGVISEAASKAFSVAGPAVWNKFEEAVRIASTLPILKTKLKTSLYNIRWPRGVYPPLSGGSRPPPSPPLPPPPPRWSMWRKAKLKILNHN